jgi:hypothetical protein
MSHVVESKVKTNDWIKQTELEMEKRQRLEKANRFPFYFFQKRLFEPAGKPIGSLESCIAKKTIPYSIHSTDILPRKPKKTRSVLI